MRGCALLLRAIGVSQMLVLYTMRFLMPRGDGAVRAECHIDIVSFLHAEPEDEGRSQQVLITLAANQGDLVITAQRLHTVM
jgi:hypothetical protein